MADLLKSDVIMVRVGRFERQLANGAIYNLQDSIDDSFQKNNHALLHAFYILVPFRNPFLLLTVSLLPELDILHKSPVAGDIIIHEKVGFQFLLIDEDIV